MRIEFETHSDGEITFIMEVIYDENDEIRRMECIGWYAGEENEEDTEYYKYKGNVALFDKPKKKYKVIKEYSVEVEAEDEYEATELAEHLFVTNLDDVEVHPFIKEVV